MTFSNSTKFGFSPKNKGWRP